MTTPLIWATQPWLPNSATGSVALALSPSPFWRGTCVGHHVRQWGAAAWFQGLGSKAITRMIGLPAWRVIFRAGGAR
jgi:hypothetical protein